MNLSMIASSWSMSSAMLRLGLLVLHAHLGLEAQARERRAQVVRDAGEHHGAVLLDLGELARHPVEAHVDLADLAGQRGLVEARVVFAFADAAGREREVLQRPVDQPRDGGRAEHGGEQGDADPEHQGAPDIGPTRVGSAFSQYGSRAIEKPTQRPGGAVHRAGDEGVGTELVAQLALDDALEAVDLERLPFVARLARRQLDRLERRDALDDARRG